MSKSKKIKFYDQCDQQFIYLDINIVKEVYDNFLGQDYEDIDDFMQSHQVSPKHKKYIEGEEEVQ